MRLCIGSAPGALLVLVGCQVGSVDPADGGQSGTAIPDGCVEDHRVPVDDLDAIPDGFSASAAEVLATVAGDWTGVTEIGTDEAAPVTFTVAHDGGAVEAVYRVWHRSGGDSAAGEPASTPTCEPSYAFGVVTSLDLDPWVSGEGSGPVLFPPGGATTLSAETPLDEVVGTLAPSFDTTQWDRTSLAASLTVGEPGSLALAWWGTNDPQRAATSTATSTGTVEPSGTEEPIAVVEVSRP